MEAKSPPGPQEDTVTEPAEYNLDDLDMCAVNTKVSTYILNNDLTGAIEFLTTVLEKTAQSLASDSPELADLYLLYGKTLYNYSISTETSIISKENLQIPEIIPMPQKYLAFSHSDYSDSSEENEEAENPDAGAMEADYDLQNAWEVLEVSKNIYKKKIEAGPVSDSILEKYAEVHSAIGDISMEIENFEDAAQDFKRCADIYGGENTHFNERYVAEAAFKAGCAYDFAKLPEEAVKMMVLTTRLLEARILRILKTAKSEDRPNTEAEVDDLNSLIKDINTKINELKEPSEMGSEASEGISDSSKKSTRSITDVSSIVRKKAKATEDSGNASAEKNACGDEVGPADIQ